MKMNRGGSSDSLDNGIGDVISTSSSATDFTSDDDLNDLYMMSGQPIKNKPKQEKSSNLLGSNQRVAEDKSLQQNLMGFNQPNLLGSTRHNISVSSDRPVMNSSGPLRGIGGMYNNRYGIEARSSLYSDIENCLENKIDDQIFSDHLSDQAIAPILPGESFNSLDGGPRQVNTTTNPTVRPYAANRRTANASQNRSSTTLGDGCYPSSSGYENVGILGNSLGFDGEDDDEENLFRRPDRRVIDPHVPAIAGSSRQVNHTIAAMCATLVDCRRLSEAIDFVEENRELIDNLTRIICDAPAYRNYDMSNYQVDYSVKESFNQEFWHDREPIVTTADGNCQYHAVSISLTGSEMYTQEVRLLTAVAVIDHRDWFDSILKIIDGGTVLDLVRTVARPYSWGDATTLKAIAVAIKRRIFLYTCNIGKKDYEMVKLLSKEELLDAFKEKKYRGGTGIHTYADPLVHVPANNYIMLFHKSEHFIAVLPTSQNPTMYEPYNPIVPTFS